MIWAATREAARSLWRSRRSTALAVLCLAAALAIATTAYGIIDGVLFPPTSIRDPDHLYRLRVTVGPGVRLRDEQRRTKLRDQLPFVEQITGTALHWESDYLTIVQRGTRTRAANVVDVEANYFQVLGAPSHIGRLLAPADLEAPTTPVVVSRRFWNEFYPELGTVDSAMLLINGAPHPVVGVVADDGVLPGTTTEVWMLPAPLATARVHLALVRLKRGVSSDAANDLLQRVSVRWADEIGASRNDLKLVLTPVFEKRGHVRDLHIALLAAAISVLLIASLNLANLQLARGLYREREFATRSALGASRHRLLTQAAAEGALLCMAGLALALAFSFAMTRLAASVVVPFWSGVTGNPLFSWRVVVVAMLAASAAAVIVGVWPAMRIASVDVVSALKAGHGAGISRTATRGRGVLLALQVAVAVSVTTTACLVTRAAKQIADVDVGFDPARLIHVRLFLSGSRVGDRTFRAVVTDLRTRLEEMSGVQSAAIYHPRAFPGHEMVITATDRARRRLPTGHFHYLVVEGDYLGTLGVPVRSGGGTLAQTSEPVAIVDDGLAQACWGGEDALGNVIKLGAPQSDASWVRVTGVARAFIAEPLTEASLDQESLCPTGNLIVAGTYASTAQVPRFGTEIDAVVRARGSPAALSARLPQLLAQGGTGAQTTRVDMLSEEIGLDTLQKRHLLLAGVFSGLAILAAALAAVGHFTTSAYILARRRREFAVRLALGADAMRLAWQLVREERVVLMAGAALGLLLSFWSSSLVQAQLLASIDRFDAKLFALSVAMVLVSQVCAILWPARAAGRSAAAAWLNRE